MDMKKDAKWMDKYKINLQDGYIKFLDLKKKVRPNMESLKITGIYVMIGCLWVLLSDKVIENMFTDKELLKEIQLYKGWFYVLVSGIIFYFIIKRTLILYKNAIDIVLSGYENLSVAHEELITVNEELQLQIEETEKQRNAVLSSERRYQLAVEAANDGIWNWDLQNSVYFFSLLSKSPFGYEPDEFENTIATWTNLIHPDDRDETTKVVREYLDNRKGIYECTYRMRCKSGEYRWVLSRGRGVWDENGKPLLLAGSHTDITERREIEAKLQYIAYYDTLTGLPNRAYLEMEANRAIQNNTIFAIINLDIDDFKHINDTLGYPMGDIFIRNFANMLADFIQKPDLVFRINGNKFAIMIVQMKDFTDVTERLQKLLHKVKTPWNIDVKKFYITTSMGGAIYPDHGTDFETLMQKAEMAMFYQKEKGKDGYTIFKASMQEERLNFIQMSNQLREAIENNEFILYYQPQYDLKTGHMLGVEALIRWIHPERGFVSPADFIPLSEKTGYIIEISEWVIRTAIKQKREWDEKGYPNIKMAVNLSGYVITDSKAFENICNILNELNLEPGEIEVEVTETAVMMELDKAKDNLQRLREFGISIAMDDFGTGYSSLNYLQILPFDILKIDREFIKNVKNKEEDIFIYRTVVSLAHDMNLNVVAEGIETKEQEEFLLKNNCDIGQGYYYCKPVPAKEIENILRSEHRL